MILPGQPPLFVSSRQQQSDQQPPPSVKPKLYYSNYINSNESTFTKWHFNFTSHNLTNSPRHLQNNRSIYQHRHLWPWIFSKLPQQKEFNLGFNLFARITVKAEFAFLKNSSKVSRQLQRLLSLEAFEQGLKNGQLVQQQYDGSNVRDYLGVLSRFWRMDSSAAEIWWIRGLPQLQNVNYLTRSKIFKLNFTPGKTRKPTILVLLANETNY